MRAAGTAGKVPLAVRLRHPVVGADLRVCHCSTNGAEVRLYLPIKSSARRVAGVVAYDRRASNTSGVRSGSGMSGSSG